MKFTVTMKDPDVLHDAIREAVDAELSSLPLDDEEREAAAEKRRARMVAVCGRWFKYDEYLRIEIDTDAKTATILPVE